MPKISVIVPVYKTELYLGRCIDSILNQTHQDLEIILVDDGSPDNCPAICDEYAQKDSRIKVIHQQNKGVSAARNTGLDAAIGDYVAFVDSDDLLNKRYCELLLSAAETHGADITFCGIESFSSEEELCKIPTQAQHNVMDGASALENLFSIWYQPNPFNKLIKRSLFQSSNMRFPNAVRAEDLHLMYSLLTKAHTIVGMKHCNLYYYRKTPQSAMKQLSCRHIEDDLSMRLDIYEKIFKSTYPTTAKKFAKQTLYIFQDFALSAFFSNNKCVKKCISKQGRTLVNRMLLEHSTGLIAKIEYSLLFINVNVWILYILIKHKLFNTPLYIE